MPYKEYRGSLFNSGAQTLVNTVNCVGVMGKGVALEFRLRYPEMFAEYRNICKQNKLKPGQILPYRKSNPWILNFAVKNDWKAPSRIEWVESCLNRFVANYQQLGIKSVAFPWIGAMNGGLPWEEVHKLMRRYLENINDIDVEVIEFDPNSADPMFERISVILTTMDAESFAKKVGIKTACATQIYDAYVAGRVKSMSNITSLDRIGKVSIEKIYDYFRIERTLPVDLQLSLFSEEKDQ